MLLVLKEYIAKNPIKFTIGVLGVPGAIWGCIKAGQEINTTIKNNITKRYLQELVDSVRNSRTDEALKYYSVIKEDISDIKKSQLEQSSNISDIKNSQKKLKDYMIEKAPTKDDLKQIYNIFDNEKRLQFSNDSLINKNAKGDIKINIQKKPNE